MPRKAAPPSRPLVLGSALLFVAAAGCDALARSRTANRAADSLFDCACTCVGAPFGLALWGMDKAAKGEKHLSCGVCPSGQACNPGYEPPRCRPAPGPLGEPCRNNIISGIGDDDLFPCAKGLECDRDTRKCARPVDGR